MTNNLTTSLHAILAAGALLLTGLPVQAAAPGRLFAMGGFDPDNLETVPHRIYELDPATGRATPLPGSFGPEPPAMAATADGRLLALNPLHSHGSDPGPEQSTLLEIDPYRGLLTPLAVVPAQTYGFDIFSDGRAFTIPQSGGAAPVQLHAVNLQTGALTAIGAASAIDDAFAAAFGSAPAANKRATQLGSVSNKLYAVVRHSTMANLVSFDPDTGAATVIGAANAINTSGGGRYYGIPGLSGRDSDGDGVADELYGVLNYHDQDGDPATPPVVIGALIKFNLTDGTWSLVGMNPGLLFSSLASAPVLNPTPPSVYAVRLARVDGATYVAGEEVNSRGAVAVGAYDDQDAPVAARFEGGLTLLPPLSPKGAYANSINDAGLTVGWALNDAGLRRAVAWSNGIPSDLGTLGGDRAEARGVNNAGQIVGQARNAVGQARAFLWTESSGMSELPMTLGGNRSAASAINATGVVAGSGRLANDKTHAVRYDPGTGTTLDLGTLGGDESFANGINDAGHVAGLSDDSEGGFRPFFWSPETGLVDLFADGHLGSPFGAAYDVNSAGEVVGYGEINDNYDSHAFVWSRNDGLRDLNNLVARMPGLELRGAAGINDVGQISGWGALHGEPVAFRLDPAIRLRRGHADVVVAWEADSLEFHVHDDEAGLEHAGGKVVLHVPALAQSRVPGNPAFAFLGSAGAPVWILPQAGHPKLLFLGLAAAEVEPGTFENDQIELRLAGAEGPGDFALYTVDGFGQPLVHMNTGDGISPADVKLLRAGMHEHVNWAFTRPGVYWLKLQAAGRLAAGGTPVASEEFEVCFEVIGTETRLALTRTGDTVELTFNTQEELTYQLERAPALTGPWTNEGAAFPGTGRQKHITVPLGPGSVFFRIKASAGD